VLSDKNNTNLNKETAYLDLKYKLPLQTYTLKSEQKLINIEKKLNFLGLFPPPRLWHKSPPPTDPPLRGGIEKNPPTSKKSGRLDFLLDYKNSYFRFLKKQLLNYNKYHALYHPSSPNLAGGYSPPFSFRGEPVGGRGVNTENFLNIKQKSLNELSGSNLSLSLSFLAPQGRRGGEKKKSNTNVK
jgi:hypothetical protein